MKTLCEEIFTESNIQNFILDNIVDPWKNTPLQGYVWLNNKAKGKIGESLVSNIFIKNNFSVKPRTNSGHDIIINDIKTEIKFSVCHLDKTTNRLKSNCFILNHISQNKDWERLVFFGYNDSQNPHMFFWFTKEDFKEMISQTKYFSYQQGGKGTVNDDFMSASKKLIELSKSKYVKTIDQW